MKLDKVAFLSLGLVAGIIASYGFNKLFYTRKDSHVNPNAFILAIQITFKSIEIKNKFKVLFQPMAEFVTKSEPGSITFKCMQ